MLTINITAVHLCIVALSPDVVSQLLTGAGSPFPGSSAPGSVVMLRKPSATIQRHPWAYISNSFDWSIPFSHGYFICNGPEPASALSGNFHDGKKRCKVFCSKLKKTYRMGLKWNMMKFAKVLSHREQAGSGHVPSKQKQFLDAGKGKPAPSSEIQKMFQYLCTCFK